ncbi:MAG: 50S ribosomal protein L17 [Dehalococcoidia bacterium]|nr:50S ribosomal protein L17 [Dehalococcoidia bacterium]
MRHRVSGRHLGRDTAHRTALYRNLVTDLLRYERITTTQAKAKEIRPMAEKIITLGRRGDLHARRLAARFVYDPKVVKKVFDEIGPRMKERPGGYLRITSLEARKGDGAAMASIELVDFVDAPPTPRPQRMTASPSAANLAPAPLAPAPAVEPAAEEEAPTDVMDRMVDAREDVAEVPETGGTEEPPAPPAAEVTPDSEASAEAAMERENQAAEAADEAAAEAQAKPANQGMDQESQSDRS